MEYSTFVICRNDLYLKTKEVGVQGEEMGEGMARVEVVVEEVIF